ncbi:N-sulfoglucosamine sulfohydrolase [Catalinimonas alkaloidigena]|uniref:sulfatase family protein n=1 Tax=Catalinimonas alkaloidigena TaxID=1075417 RepID=UPI00240536B1|nr:sulfatase [Catalinimonas alkaloidigena]MDF9798188.1 N-sulfoglucosamine sulfohydrolase [Catalinimonas alkaloidigena]
MRKIIFLLSLLTFYACQPQEQETHDQRPNILFAIADDASFPHMGAYGTNWVNTPAFDRVASEGLLFNNAYTPNAKCAPSRSCILTGRNSWQLEEAANHVPFFPAKFTTFMESLAEHGYFTGHTAKGWSPGDPGERNGKRRELTGPAFNEYMTTPPAEFMSNNDYARNFEDFLQARPDSLPFCFWFGAIEPHRAYEYGAGINKGGKQIDQIDEVPEFWPDTDSVRTDMLDYAYEIEYFDQHLMRMLEILEENGQLDNTIIVVTADNGMPFPRVKGNAYELSNHLPLAMMWTKGIKNAGRKIDDFISFIDFAPTFMELAQISPEQNSMQVMQGKSMTDIFQAEKEGMVNPDRDHVLIGKERHDVGRPNDWGYPIRGIVTDDLLYVQNFEPDRWPSGNPETGYLNTDGGATKTQILNMRYEEDMRAYWLMNFGKRPAEELYRIDEDPDCVHNLALNPEYTPMLEELKVRMLAELQAQGDPRMMGNGHVFDEYTYANESNRNFYERYMEGEEVNHGWVNDSDFQEEEE